MPDWLDSVGNTLADVAPTIASAAGGPFAGKAVKKLMGVLGVDSEEEAKKMIQTMDPQTRLKLQKAEQQFELEMRKQAVEMERIRQKDRASAREREAKTEDRAVKILAVAVTFGFFALLGSLLFADPPSANRSLLDAMIGVLGTAWIAVINYYFGSSMGSKAKEKILGMLATPKQSTE